MSEKIRLLFVDDEEEFLTYMSKRLTKRDLEVAAFTSGPQALAETEGQSFDVALLDLKMPEMDGEALLAELKARDPRLEVIMLTGHGTIESAFSASRSGACEYLLKPCELDDVVSAISAAYAKRIKALQQEKTERVNELVQQAKGLSPLGLLQELKKLKDES